MGRATTFCLSNGYHHEVGAVCGTVVDEPGVFTHGCGLRDAVGCVPLSGDDKGGLMFQRLDGVSTPPQSTLSQETTLPCQNPWQNTCKHSAMDSAKSVSVNNLLSNASSASSLAASMPSKYQQAPEASRSKSLLFRKPAEFSSNRTQQPVRL